jgi:hypothetical protein
MGGIDISQIVPTERVVLDSDFVFSQMKRHQSRKTGAFQMFSCHDGRTRDSYPFIWMKHICFPEARVEPQLLVQGQQTLVGPFLIDRVRGSPLVVEFYISLISYE